jgi:hypothetical protein
MKTILIILGWTAGQIQESSTTSLDVADVYDIDGRSFRGPIVVRYELGNSIIELPEAEFVSLSFTFGVLTSATVNPERRPLDGVETANLCQALVDTFARVGSAFVFSEADDLKRFAEGLRVGRVPAESPPWSFGARLGGDSMTVSVRPFDSSSARATGQLYVTEVEFGNLRMAEAALDRMHAARAKAFPNRRGPIRMSEYPKESK